MSQNLPEATLPYWLTEAIGIGLSCSCLAGLHTQNLKSVSDL